MGHTLRRAVADFLSRSRTELAKSEVGLQISARPISLDVGGADTALGSTYDDGGVQQRWTTEAATARREDPKRERESPAGSALLCFRTGTAPSRTLAGSEAPGAVWCVAMQVSVRLAESAAVRLNIH